MYLENFKLWWCGIHIWWDICWLRNNYPIELVDLKEIATNFFFSGMFNITIWPLQCNLERCWWLHLHLMMGYQKKYNLIKHVSFDNILTKKCKQIVPKIVNEKFPVFHQKFQEDFHISIGCSFLIEYFPWPFMNIPQVPTNSVLRRKGTNSWS